MINVRNIVAVGGKSGLFKLLSVRNDGIIIEDFDTQKREFAPTRQHQFSPLETISIYTDIDATPLAQVFSNMNTLLETQAIPSEKSDSKLLRNYFEAVLPEHDRDRVHISDIKKIIKWFNFLQARNLLVEAEEEPENTEETPAEN